MCYVLRSDEFALNLMADDFCQFHNIREKDREKLIGNIHPNTDVDDLFEVEINSLITENLLFYVIDQTHYKGKYFTDYPLNKVIGFPTRSALEKAIDAFNDSQSDYYIDGSADTANFVRCSIGNIYLVPVDNYFLAQMFINFAKKDAVLSSFVREGYERVAS